MTPKILFYNSQCAKKGYQRLPAAILQVASFIDNEYEYEILDGNLFEHSSYADVIIDKAKKGLKYLAISIMPGPQLLTTVKDLRKIKKETPNLIVIAGGYFPLNHSEVCINDQDIDYVVIGPGEETFRELIYALEHEEDPSEILGLGFIKDGKSFTTHKRSPVHPNNLPIYPYHKLEVEKYVTSTVLGKRTLSHHSSFGCPFFCNFCAVVTLAEGKWFAQDAAKLVDLAAFMVEKWNIDALEFHDNNFFTSEARVKEFCLGIIDKGLKITWWGEGRVDTLNRYSLETWQLMRDSGLKMIFLGAESSDDETLKLMNKGGTQTSQTVVSLVKTMRDYSIIPELSFILGNPPNPQKDIANNIEFIRKIKKINPLSEIIIYRYDPIPVGGEMFENVTKLGFEFPQTLDEWINPSWRKVQKRVFSDVQWLTEQDQTNIDNFQTVLNAYYPTSTSRNIKKNSWKYWLLKSASALRYHLKIYTKPNELTWLHKKLLYQRPEVSGF